MIIHLVRDRSVDHPPFNGPMVRSSERPTPAGQGSSERDGLTTFLTQWEINDLIFMVVEENLRPEQTTQKEP